MNDLHISSLNIALNGVHRFMCVYHLVVPPGPRHNGRAVQRSGSAEQADLHRRPLPTPPGGGAAHGARLRDDYVQHERLPADTQETARRSHQVSEKKQWRKFKSALDFRSATNCDDFHYEMQYET